jgi:hypothetical protein
MAISPISPISNATSFIQAALSARLLSPAQAFEQVLATSVSGPPTSPAALAAARPGDFATALEQVLFRNLVSTVERADLSTLTPALQPLFAGELGLTSPLSPDALQPLLAGASPAERAVLSANLTSLFSTIQLLGTEPDQEPQLGSLLDLLA